MGPSWPRSEEGGASLRRPWAQRPRRPLGVCQAAAQREEPAVPRRRLGSGGAARLPHVVAAPVARRRRARPGRWRRVWPRRRRMALRMLFRVHRVDRLRRHRVRPGTLLRGSAHAARRPAALGVGRLADARRVPPAPDRVRVLARRRRWRRAQVARALAVGPQPSRRAHVAGRGAVRVARVRVGGVRVGRERVAASRVCLDSGRWVFVW